MIGRAGSFDHPCRARIYEHLLRVPGDHYRSIARSLGLSLGTAGYHLSVLVHSRLVDVRSLNGRRRFFPRGAGSQAEVNALFEKHWNYRGLRVRVLLAVQRRKDTRLCAIAAALGISRQLAAYHLSHLVKDGLIERIDDRYSARDGASPSLGTSALPHPMNAGGNGGVPVRFPRGDERERLIVLAP